MNPNTESDSGDAPQTTAPEICDRLFSTAHLASASDLHLQPLPDGTANVLFRLDGVLRTMETLDSTLAPLVCGRIKFLAKLKTYEHSTPQDGRISHQDAGLDQELRVSTYPTVAGEKIVIRFFSDQQVGPLDQLGFDMATLTELKSFLQRRQGLLLLTGPSGSGKTSTIYGCLHDLRDGDQRHVITVEDPVEQIIPGIMQTEVNEARGLTYPKSIRHLLRQDPEVIVIGEIRDDETAEIAVRAALTGHQVIATLHAGSCHGVLDRIRVMVEDRFAVASVLELVANQRLVRKICVTCQGEGCTACAHSGYHGRVPVVETMKIGPTDRDQLQTGKCPTRQPMPSLKQAAARLIDLGITDAAEISRVVGT